MTVEETSRGFRLIQHPIYPQPQQAVAPIRRRLVQESSLIGDYDDAMGRPGSSYLWVGQDHHLNREEVAELVGHLKRWLDGGRLS